jgi:hypothetical protein
MYGSIAVADKSFEAAMNKVKADWYSDFFEYDFTVQMVDSTSGIYTKPIKEENHV